jgi:hypothetical protein
MKIGIIAACFVVMVLIFIGLALWAAFVATHLWQWFLVEQFNAPKMGVAQAMGVGLVFGIFTYGIPRRGELIEIIFPGKSDIYRIGRLYCTMALTPTLLLGVGYGVKQFL